MLPLAADRRIARQIRDELGPEVQLPATNLFFALPSDSLVCVHRETSESLFHAAVKSNKGGLWIFDRTAGELRTLTYLPPVEMSTGAPAVLAPVESPS